MFGKKKKLEQRLAAGELRRIEAEVLSTQHLMGSAGAADSLDASGEWHVRVRVSPPGEEPFEASFNYFAEILALAPHEGALLPVAYDPEDRGAVIWDGATAGSAAAEKGMLDRERRERIAAERREQGLPPLGSKEDGPDPDLIAKLAELQGRKDRGELNDWNFRVARAEIMKEKGF